LIDACIPHKYYRDFPVRTLLRPSTYGRVAERWAEFGLPGVPPTLDEFDEEND